MNGLTYQYKQNTYLHKWLLSFLPFLPLCYSNFLDVTVTNIYTKIGLAMGFNFRDRNSANRHKTHKLWHQSSLTQTMTSMILLLSVCTLAIHYITHKNTGTFEQTVFPLHYYIHS